MSDVVEISVSPVEPVENEEPPTSHAAYVSHAKLIGGGAITIVQFWVVVSAVPPVESVTCAVKVNVPAAVGVPVIAPVPAANVRPPGSVPETIEYVYGAVPPPATSDEL